MYSSKEAAKTIPIYSMASNLDVSSNYYATIKKRRQNIKSIYKRNTKKKKKNTSEVQIQ